MRVLFCASSEVGAVLIRAATWSDWSHVALIDGDQVIEAVWPQVRVTPLADVIAAHPRHMIVELPCAEPARAVAAARSQVGKPYDVWGIVGLGLHRDWTSEDAWWCSELVAWSCAQGGTPLFRPEGVRRVTPQHLWMLAPSWAGGAK